MIKIVKTWRVNAEALDAATEHVPLRDITNRLLADTRSFELTGDKHDDHRVYVDIDGEAPDGTSEETFVLLHEAALEACRKAASVLGWGDSYVLMESSQYANTVKRVGCTTHILSFRMHATRLHGTKEDVKAYVQAMVVPALVAAAASSSDPTSLLRVTDSMKAERAARDAGDAVLNVDYSVYDNFKKMRMLYGCKPGDPMRPMRLVPALAGQPQQTAEDTLITYILPGSVRLEATAPAAATAAGVGPRKRASEGAAPPAKKTTFAKKASSAEDSVEDHEGDGKLVEEDDPLLDALLAVIHSVSRYVNCTIREVKEKTSGYSVTVVGSRYCARVGHEHASNNISLLILRRTVHQRCLDPDCREFASAPLPVPPSLLAKVWPGGYLEVKLREEARGLAYVTKSDVYCLPNIHDGTIDTVSRSHLHNAYEDASFHNGSAKQPFLKEWMQDSTRMRYSSADFWPSHEERPGILNLFRSFAYERLLADDSIGLASDDEIADVMWLWAEVHGSEAAAKYAHDLIALKLQRPLDPPRVCCVYFGGSGLGKDSIVQALIGDHVFGRPSFFNVENAERDVFGHFNKQLERTVHINFEEADAKTFFGERFKSMVTGTHTTINPKGIASYEVSTFNWFTVTTNRPTTVRLEQSDRRMVFYQASDHKHKQDAAIFSRFHNDVLKNPRVIKRLVHDWLARDLTGFNYIVDRPVSRITLIAREAAVPIHVRFLRDAVLAAHDNKQLARLFDAHSADPLSTVTSASGERMHMHTDGNTCFVSNDLFCKAFRAWLSQDGGSEMLKAAYSTTQKISAEFTVDSTLTLMEGDAALSFSTASEREVSMRKGKLFNRRGWFVNLTEVRKYLNSKGYEGSAVAVSPGGAGPASAVASKE
jgi:hypothetical protein